jgi:hypothetical protein
MSELTSGHLSTRTQSVVFRTPHRTDLLLLAPLSLARFLAIQQQFSIRNNNAKFLVSYTNLINYITIKSKKCLKFGKLKIKNFQMAVLAFFAFSLIYFPHFIFYIFNLFPQY